MFALKPVVVVTAAAATFLLSSPVHAASSSQHAVADFNTCAKPHYPAESLAAKHVGKVDLAFLVDANGAVQEAKIRNSSGHDLLDIAARDAIKLCKFAPATTDGKAVQSWAKVRYVWTLK